MKSLTDRFNDDPPSIQEQRIGCIQDLRQRPDSEADGEHRCGGSLQRARGTKPTMTPDPHPDQRGLKKQQRYNQGMSGHEARNESRLVTSVEN